MAATGKLWLKLALTLLATAVVMTLLIGNIDGINGPPFFPWPWRPIPGTRIYVSFAIGAVPFFLALLLDRKSRAMLALAIALLMLSCFALKLASVMFRDDVTPADSPNLQLIHMIVENPAATSYYTDAISFDRMGLSLRQWIDVHPHPDVMPRLNLHSQSKPPGPILYWWCLIKLMGAGARTVLVGGLLLGALGTLSIPATYLLLRQLHNDDEPAFLGAAFLSLCPGFVLFFPYLDPVFIVLSCALIGLWFMALRYNRRRYAMLLGLMLAITGFITFNVLVIGLFMVGMVIVGSGASIGRRLLLAAKQGAIALVTTVVVLALMFIAIRYDPIATFRMAWINQHELLRQHAEQRVYPLSIPFDLTDFALGAGWIGVLLAIFWAFGRDDVGTIEPPTSPGPGDEVRPGASSFSIAPSSFVWLTLLQLVAVAVLGLLQTETARVWNFMLPLLMIPVGLELSHWPRWSRLVPYACLLLVGGAICQNVKWIY